MQVKRKLSRLSERFWHWLGDSVHRRPWAFLLGLAVLTVIGLLGARKLGLNSDMSALLPSSTPSVKHLKAVMKKTGGLGDLQVLIECPDPKKARAFAAKVLPELQKKSWVMHAEFKVDLNIFGKNKILYADLKDLEKLVKQLKDRVRYEKRKRNPLFVGLDDDEDNKPPPKVDVDGFEKKYKKHKNKKTLKYHQARGGKLLIVVAYPKGRTGDINFAYKIQRETVAMVAALKPDQYHPDIKVHVGGLFKNRIDQFEAIINDVKGSALVAILGIFLIITIFFRNILSVPLIFLSLGTGLAWTFGFAYLVLEKHQLNMIAVFLVVILIGVGIDFSIHLLARYMEERHGGMAPREALIFSLTRAGPPIVASAFTTAAAFLTMSVAKFQGFHQFGLVAGVGVFLILVAALFSLPTLVILVERLIPLTRLGFKWKARTRIFNKKVSPRAARWVLAGAFLFTAFGFLGIGLGEVSFEYNMDKLRSKLPHAQPLLDMSDEVFTKLRDPALVYAPDMKTLKVIHKTLDTMKKSKVGRAIIRDADSVLDALPREQQKKFDVVAKLRKVVKRAKRYLKTGKLRKRIDEYEKDLNPTGVTLEKLPPSIKRAALVKGGKDGFLMSIYARKTLLDLRNAIEFAEYIRWIDTPLGKFPTATEMMVFTDMMKLVKEDAVLGVLLASLVILLILLLIFRRFAPSLLLYGLLVNGLSWLALVMWISGMKLTLFNMVVLPAILGIGIDNLIHLYHRLKEDPSRGVIEPLWKVGSAIITCVLTTMVGFGSMLVALHPGLRTIGGLAVAGLVCGLLSTLIMLPAAVAARKQKQ